MDAEEYLKLRVENQISWYAEKSKDHQRMFKILRYSEIIFAAMIPFISGLSRNSAGTTSLLAYILGGLGVLISIIAGMLGLGQFQERWIEYRTTCESLKKEKYLFETKVEPYHELNAFAILVQRVETLVSKENTNWARYMMKPKKDESNKS